MDEQERQRRITEKIENLLKPTVSIAASIMGRKGGKAAGRKSTLRRLARLKAEEEKRKQDDLKPKLDEPQAPKDEPKPFVSVLTIR